MPRFFRRKRRTSSGPLVRCLWKHLKVSYLQFFYLNGKNFCLRGGVEHRQLKLSQIKRVDDPPSYIYTECASKNRAGGLAQLRVKNKAVPIHAVAEAGDRCHVYILDRYMEKIPKEAIKKDNFYLQPIAKVKDPAQPWFTTVPVGRNVLSKMVKNICEDARVSGQKTNHSLRATGATEMYHTGVPEKVIQERTGYLYLSLDFVSTSEQVVSSNAQSNEYSHLVKMYCTRAHPWLRLLPACPQLL